MEEEDDEEDEDEEDEEDEDPLPVLVDEEHWLFGSERKMRLGDPLALRTVFLTEFAIMAFVI